MRSIKDFKEIQDCGMFLATVVLGNQRETVEVFITQ